MKNTIFLLIIGIITLAASCKKENINPEPEHEDIFKCKVNGELWEPAGGDGSWGFNKKLFVYYEQEFLNSIYISARKEIVATDTISQTILLYPNLIDPLVGKHPFYYREHYVDRLKNDSYYLDTLHYNFFEITAIDSIEKIITGGFQFKAIAAEIKDTVLVTDGEFSVRY